MTEPSSGPGAPHRKVALVIGAGSVKCAAAIGIMKVLEREGVEVDLLVGCSGGSIYAGVMALGVGPAESERLTMELWDRAVTRRQDFRSMASIVLTRFFPGHFQLVDDRILLERLAVPFGDRTFDDCATPLRIVATDLHEGEKVVISSGSMLDAIRGSVAIPYVWSPWRVGDRLLVDGCMSDPLPVDVAIREGAHLIIALGFESPYPRRIRSATRYAFHINSVYTNNLLRANFAFHNLAHHSEIVLVMPQFERRVSLFDTHEIPYVIAQGEKAAEAQLPYLKRVLAEVHA